jgi:hypothetical protein
VPNEYEHIFSLAGELRKVPENKFTISWKLAVKILIELQKVRRSDGQTEK